MLLGGEIDDPARATQLARVGDEHVADLDGTGFACGFVGGEVLRVALLEHEGNAFAHYTDGVDRVYHGVNVGFEQVTLPEIDHVQKYQPGRTTACNERLRLWSSVCNLCCAASQWQPMPRRPLTGKW